MLSIRCPYFAGRKKACIEIPVALLLFLLFSIHATASDYSIITAGLDPWSMEGNTGIFPDIVKEIEKRLGTNKIPIKLPLNRALKYNSLTGESFIFAPVPRTDSYEKDFTWIADVMPFEIVFVAFGNDPVDLETARGLKRILVYHDLPAYDLLVEKGFKNIYTYPFGKFSPLKMLAIGRVDAWCVERTYAIFFARGTPHDGKLVFGPPILKTRLYI